MDLNYKPTKVYIDIGAYKFVKLSFLSVNREGNDIVIFECNKSPYKFQCSARQSASLSYEYITLNIKDKYDQSIYHNTYENKIEGWSLLEINNRILKYETIINTIISIINDLYNSDHINNELKLSDIFMNDNFNCISGNLLNSYQLRNILGYENIKSKYDYIKDALCRSELYISGNIVSRYGTAHAILRTDNSTKQYTIIPYKMYSRED